MDREEIILSPSALRAYDLIDKPLTEDRAEAIAAIKNELDEIRAELRVELDELRLRMAARQGATITPIDDDDGQPGLAGDEPLKHRPASVR